MNRRDFLLLHGRSSLVALAACALPSPVEASPAPSSGSIAATYVPGYKPRGASYQGVALADHPRFNKALPAGYDGPVTLLSRVSGPGEPSGRAAFPIRGHAACVRSGTGFFNSMNGHTMLSFDPLTLEMGALTGPHRDGWVGGGHGAFSADGRYLFVSERRANAAYSGAPSDHFGAITVREPQGLKVLAAFSCYGVAPHDIRLIENGKYLAVANYGSTQPPSGSSKDPLPFIVEPCVTILEVESGRLVHKIHAPNRESEVRHLAADDRRRMMLVQARVGPPAEEAKLLLGNENVYVPDFSAEPGTIYLPAPMLHVAMMAGNQVRVSPVAAADPLLMRHGLSIVHEPVHDEFIISFPTSHCIMVFDGETGGMKRIVRTEPLGLSYPCGLALHPDGRHYIVTGSWRGLCQFWRGSHQLDRRATSDMLFLEHSHIAVA